MVFKKIKEMFSSSPGQAEYVEIDLGAEDKKSKVMVRPFVLKSFDDINPVLNSLREGYTIAIIDIKPLKGKDVIELKRAISKIKKTAEAINGNIAGFGENTILVTPEFAQISREDHSVGKVERVE